MSIVFYGFHVFFALYIFSKQDSSRVRPFGMIIDIVKDDSCWANYLYLKFGGWSCMIEPARQISPTGRKE